LQALRHLFPRPLDAHQTGFAMGETVAHLNRLVKSGRLQRLTRPDGVWLYKTICK